MLTYQPSLESTMQKIYNKFEWISKWLTTRFEQRNPTIRLCKICESMLQVMLHPGKEKSKIQNYCAKFVYKVNKEI